MPLELIADRIRERCAEADDVKQALVDFGKVPEPEMLITEERMIREAGEIKTMIRSSSDPKKIRIFLTDLW